MYIHVHVRRMAFFKDLKHQIQRGQLSVPEEVKKTVGALTAQIEIGDYRETHPHAPALIYPAYFPDWNDGVAFNISKEHKKLRGQSTEPISLQGLKRSQVEVSLNIIREHSWKLKNQSQQRLFKGMLG